MGRELVEASAGGEPAIAKSHNRDYYRSHNRRPRNWMKFVTVRDLRGKTSELWKELEHERELVVTSNGKPIAILSATDEDSFESCLWTLRRSRANDALAKLQRDAEQRGLSDLTPEEIDAEIQTSRKKRKAG